MRSALAQLNSTVGAFEQKFVKIDAAVSRAKVADADLLVFSEMAATGPASRFLRKVSQP